MVRLVLKGVAKVTAKGHTYWYAWRSGPRLRGEPGSPEFIASYNEAIENVRTQDKNRFRFVIISYKESHDYKRLADSTKRNWAPWLDRIGIYFGELRIAQFDRPEKIRPVIRKWRDQWADTPRTADYGMQVLSRVLSHAVDIGKIASNPSEGIKKLYSSDRSEIIWTDEDIARLKEGSESRPTPPEIIHAVDLACCTGLRLSDLLAVSWSHVSEHAIFFATGKSRGRRNAIIPMSDEVKEVLDRIPKVSTTILANSYGRPWTANGFGTAFDRAKKSAEMGERDLHFHDFRGTAATKFYLSGLSVRLIAEILAWSEARVERIIRRYVGQGAAIKAAIGILNKASEGKKGT
ncbi:MAG: tyrosine-type recombinase/integrase [Alphaproteobacteria bacterium]|nr:tyrosine-type recombinase/integrase [Alphaproteobacteria bacterium]